MKKLTTTEQNALNFVARQKGQSYCPDDDAAAEPGIMGTLDSLARKKRLRKEATDAAPRYHLTAQGMVEVDNG